MKKLLSFKVCLIFLTILSLLSVSVIISAQSYKTRDGPPPVSQALVREGAFAQDLSKMFGFNGDVNEVTAESWLSERGILPANGWIADYPLTPDIIGELRKSIQDASITGKIHISSVDALSQFDGAVADLGLDVDILNAPQNAQVAKNDDEIIPQEDIYNYYSYEGPPIVTYYAPPVDYYGLYSWISYPFWCDGFWFGGYYILNDFHRPAPFDRHHHLGFISNHFRDKRNADGRGSGEQRLFTRIDPQTRASGATAVGVGFTRNRRSNPLASDSAHIYSPPAIRSTPVNSQIKVPQGIPGVQSNLYGASRETSSHRGGSSQHSENYIPNQHNINRTNPSVSSPSRNISTSQPAYTSPRSNSNVNRFYTPSDNNRLQSGSSRSFNNGFNGGSNSIGHTSGTNGIRSSSSNSSQRVGFSSGNSGNFGGGHRGR